MCFRPGVPGSNLVKTLYLYYAFIHLFPFYGLCSYESAISIDPGQPGLGPFSAYQPHELEVVGSIPGRNSPKSLKKLVVLVFRLLA